MNNEQQSCALEDLEAVLDAYEQWSVDGNGAPLEQHTAAETYGTFDEVVEYMCHNCGECFTPEDRYNPEQRALAWQFALDHVKQREAA